MCLFMATEAQNLMTVIKQKNIRCNGTFCTLAKPLWFDRKCCFCFAFRLYIVCKYYSLFERKCSYTYQLYTYIFTFYCTFNENLLHLLQRKKKKNCKTKCTKKCFPYKHGNPPCCLLLLYLKTHVVQLSTSEKAIPLSFFVFKYRHRFSYRHPNNASFILINFIP